MCLVGWGVFFQSIFSVKSQKGVSVTSGPIDRTSGIPGSDKKPPKAGLAPFQNHQCLRPCSSSHLCCCQSNSQDRIRNNVLNCCSAFLQSAKPPNSKLCKSRKAVLPSSKITNVFIGLALPLTSAAPSQILNIEVAIMF